MILLALYYTLLTIWAASSAPGIVQNIASLLPFWLVYILLLVNTFVCLWGRLDVLKNQISRSPVLTRGPANWEMKTGLELNEQEIFKMFRDQGYRPRLLEKGYLWGVRRRWSALGTFVFHGAFGLLAAGFLLTFVGRREASVWVAVGEEFSGQPEQFLSQTAPRALSLDLPSVSFRLANIIPEYWRDELLFTNLEAHLILPGERRATTRINRPLWWNWSTFVRLSGFGYAPRYELTDHTGRILDSAFVKLNVFPPGQRDFFKVAGYPHRFYVEVLPDYGLTEGEAITRSLNLVNPAVVLHVLRGKVDLGGATLLKEDSFELEGLRVRFPEIRYWGQFSMVRDPGAPIVFSGFLLGLMGLLLKLSGKRTELTWQSADDGNGAFRGWGRTVPEGWKRLGSS